MQAFTRKKFSLPPTVPSNSLTRAVATYPYIEDYPTAPVTLTCRKGGRLASSYSRITQNGLVSIVTVVRNARATLSRTIDSVRSQTYPNVELIVVDGGSTDGTLALIQLRETDIDLWISEQDCGIADAFNKGIALTAGEFIALVNADDWIAPTHIETSISHLKMTGADFSYGNLTVHGTSGDSKYAIIGDTHYRRRLRHAMPAVNHPTMVARRTLYVQNGLFDLQYRIAMDYEWLLRNDFRGAVGSYCSDVMGHMGAAGVSQRLIRESLLEVRKASTYYGHPESLARIRYYIRLSKAHVRIFLERHFPAHFVDYIHAVVNSSFRRTSSRPNT